MLVSKLCIIKASPKSDMAIIWINIQNVQSSVNARSLINRCFNIGSHITTIKDTNMNSRISQYKNCWKQGYTMFMCHVHGSKCIKCNGSHKIEYYRHFVWCFKVNFKTNPPRLKMKSDKLCLHSFKCINYKRDYQADSYMCPFWKHQFNKK